MFNKYIAFLFVLNVISSLSKCTAYTLSDHLNWECANNATCLKEVSTQILETLKQNESITIGGISVDPIDTAQFSGRSFSFSGLLNGNRLKVPLGPVLMSVQRSKDYSDYIEVALLRKSNEGMICFFFVSKIMGLLGHTLITHFKLNHIFIVPIDTNDV